MSVGRAVGCAKGAQEVGFIVIVEYTHYKIDVGRRESFEKAYVRAVEALVSSSQCLAYELSHCTEDPDYYTLRIEWDSEEGHLKGFRSSSEFKRFFALVEPFVKDIKEMRHYEVIWAVERSQPASSHA